MAGNGERRAKRIAGRPRPPGKGDGVIRMLSNEEAESILFGPIDPGKDCGACVVCCKAMAIDTPELRKPAGVLCRYNTGSGCGIYDDRPPVCRQWHCGWIRSASLSADLRPDKSDLLIKYIVNPDAPRPFERFCVVIQIMGHEMFTKDNLYRVIDQFKERHIPVWVSFEGQMKLVHPSHDIACHINDGTIAAGRTGDEVTRWREALS
jgi:hypothetical protein